jgi:ankyrin repeat protein
VQITTLLRAAAIAFAATFTVTPFALAADTRPPLVIAIDHDDPQMFRQALQNGGDVNGLYERETMLTYALRTKRRDIAKLILQTPGVDVNKRGTDYNEMVWWSRTPLILAASMGQPDIVSTLLKMGAAVNAKDSSDNTPEARGSTALIKAAQRDQADAIRVLLTEAKGVDVNAKNRDGMPAMWFVAEADDFASVKLLREHGASANIANNEGRSILGTTIRHKHYDVVDYLVAQGADINRIDSRGLTVLDDAILSLKSDDRRTVRAFIEHFLSFKPKLDLQKLYPNGYGGEPALHLAAQFGHADVVALLLDRGADVNLKSLARRTTALLYAVYANQPEVAKVLIAHQANLEATGMYGETPLQAATQARKSELIEILTAAGAAQLKPKTYGPVTPAVTTGGANTAAALPLDKLYGTWTGTQDGIDYAVMTLTLNKSGSYSFTSKFTAAALKKYPKGTPTVIAAHQGSYTITGGALTLTPTSAPPTTLTLSLQGATLLVNGNTHMKKGK